MKLLTLNIGSGVGYDPEKQLRVLAQALSDQKYDVVALQQVNQLTGSPEVPIENLNNYIPCQDRVPVKQSNFAYQLCEAMKNSGQTWYWSWLPVHLGYERFDEGVAVLTPHPIRKTHAFYLSNSTDYQNFKTRMALGIETVLTGELEWFYSVQFGWWNDEGESFQNQWDRFMRKIGGLKAPVYVLGDFSTSADQKGESYDYILNTSPFKDSFSLAQFKDSGITYSINEEEGDHGYQSRTDFILTNQDEPVLSSHILFKNEKYQRISDHFGLSVSFGEEKDVVHKAKKVDIPEFSSKKTQPAPLTIIRTGGPMVMRTRRVRMMNDPAALLRELLHDALRQKDILETISFEDEE